MELTATPDEYKTIEEADAAVASMLERPMPDEITEALTPFERTFLARSLPLRRFLTMRYLSRQNADVAEQHKAHDEHNRAAFRADMPARRHIEGFKFAFGEVSARSGGGAFGGGAVRRFLDLGCAPGGFAAWILEENVHAAGVGITLSAEAKGIRMHLDSGLLERFDLRYGDVRDYAMGREELGEVAKGGFDLVTAHAAIMLADDVIRWNHATGLVYAQILLAVQHLAPDGALVISCRTRPLHWVVDIIRFLFSAFGSVTAVNPTYQARRPFAYVVCRGFRMAAGVPGTAERDDALRRLHAAVAYLEESDAGPIDEPGRGTANIPRLCGAPDEPIPEEAYEAVLCLFKGVWQSKYRAIRASFEKVITKRSKEAKKGAAGAKYRPPASRWPAQTVDSERREPFGWQDRAQAGAEPDIYQQRRNQKNAGLNALFNRRDGVSGGADGEGSWRRG